MRVAARTGDLSGKTVAELWDFMFQGEIVFPTLREELARRYPGIRFVDYETFGDTHGPWRNCPEVEGAQGRCGDLRHRCLRILHARRNPGRVLRARFLHYTDCAPEARIALLPAESREATVWNIAVNGAMADCRPEYMPILIAVVAAIADPNFRLEDAGSTPDWEPLIVLNGPLIRELDFNNNAGVMRVGRQANTSSGRFLRRYMRNVCGWRILPVGSDKGSIAGTFHVVMAENEEAAAELGWQSFSADQGFAADDNVVTVQSVVSVSPPMYTGGDTAESHLRVLAEAMADEMRYWCFTGFHHGRWFPLLVLGPAIAKVIAGSGWSKDAIRRYLYNNIHIKAGG